MANKKLSSTSNKLKNYCLLSSHGATLIEILLYIGLTSIMILGITSFAHTVLQSKIRAQVINSVEQQGLFVMQMITQTIRNAENINNPAQGLTDTSISLNVVNSSNDPTIFNLSNGAINIKEGAVAPIPLTNSRVMASNLTFQNLSRPNTPGTVQIQFTLIRTNPTGRQEYEYSKTFSSSASLR